MEDSLITAVISGSLGEIRRLLAMGVDINCKNRNGHTPLSHAAMDGNNQIVSLLISNQVDVNSQDNSGYTPLYWAARYGHTETVSQLINAGASPSVKDNNGSLPLHCAAWDGHKEIVSILITAGSDLQSPNRNNQSPEDLARDNNHPDIANMIRSEIIRQQQRNNQISSIQNQIAGLAYSASQLEQQNSDRASQMESLQRRVIELQQEVAVKNAQIDEVHHLKELLRISQNKIIVQERQLAELDFDNRLNHLNSLKSCGDLEVKLLENLTKVQKRRTKLLEDTKDSRLCCICKENEKIIALNPCCHLVYCEVCAIICELNNCPICRQEVQSTTKIYI